MSMVYHTKMLLSIGFVGIRPYGNLRRRNYSENRRRITGNYGFTRGATSLMIESGSSTNQEWMERNEGKPDRNHGGRRDNPSSS